VPGSVADSQGQSSKFEEFIVTHLANIVGLGELQGACCQGLDMGTHLVPNEVQRVRQPLAIRSVDPGRCLVIATNRDDRPGVIEVPVRHQDGHGLQPVLSHGVRHGPCTVLSRIHDEALLPAPRGHDPAVCGPRACRETNDEHWRRLPVRLVHSTTVTTSRRERQLAEAKRARQAKRHRDARRRRATTAVAVLTVLIGVVALALVWRPWENSPEQAAPVITSPTSDGVCRTPEEPRADNLNFATYDSSAADGVTSLQFDTNCGPITIGLDSRSPETAASMAFLAKSGYFDGVRCHRVTTAGIYVLQCGDPRGNGTGGPGYTIPDENLPTINDNGVALYPRGIVAMANAGPGTGGSQFFIVYRDSPLPPNYTVWGQISAGIDTIDYVADGGVSGGGADGVPTRPLQFTSVTLKP
jgi:peptidyl-prolyl cis-trans isomerase B (cyclophilin B)